MRVDLARLRADMMELGRIGRSAERPGINRPSYSPADMAGREYFMRRCADAGLDTHMDAVGNVLATWHTGSGGTLLTGSHLDTVPDGGLFDGALGCCAALEAVRCLRQQGVTPAQPITVVATAEEEGRFGGMLGAQALAGTVDPLWFAAARDEHGVALTAALRAAGLDPDRLPACALPPGSIDGFIELHVEQGPVLDRAGDAIGVVEVIAGVFVWVVTFTGVANHSGSTPMEMRQDALTGLVEFAAAFPAMLEAVGTANSRLTVGKVELAPNFAHTIPGRATFSLVGRDTDEAVMRALAERLERRLAEIADAQGLTLELVRTSWLAPTALDPDLAQATRRVAEVMGYRQRSLPSGGGHDAQSFAAITRSGLIFVPSIGGISHAPNEDTAWADVERGANVLLGLLMQQTAAR